MWIRIHWIRIRIRIQHFKWIRIRTWIQGVDAKIEKNTVEIFLFFFNKKNCNLLILGLHKGRSSYRRSLQASKKRTFSTSKKFINCFPFFWATSSIGIRISIANPDPDTDPGTPLNPDPIRIHNTASDHDGLIQLPTRAGLFFFSDET